MAEQLHVVLHPVRADRAGDFERFITDVVQPAVLAQRPDLEKRWRALRSSGTSDGVVTYVFLLEGGSLAEDWELDILLVDHYGEEEAARLVADWMQTFAALDPWAEAAVAGGRESNQLVWSLEAVTPG